MIRVTTLLAGLALLVLPVMASAQTSFYGMLTCDTVSAGRGATKTSATDGTAVTDGAAVKSNAGTKNGPGGNNGGGFKKGVGGKNGSGFKKGNGGNNGANGNGGSAANTNGRPSGVGGRALSPAQRPRLLKKNVPGPCRCKLETIPRRMGSTHLI
jgi:hypothetical protein